nr:hypothetical protein Q903MT_gene2055 [Picea sitchensis]
MELCLVYPRVKLPNKIKSPHHGITSYHPTLSYRMKPLHANKLDYQDYHIV